MQQLELNRSFDGVACAFSSFLLRVENHHAANRKHATEIHYGHDSTTCVEKEVKQRMKEHSWRQQCRNCCLLRDMEWVVNDANEDPTVHFVKYCFSLYLLLLL